MEANELTVHDINFKEDVDLSANNFGARITKVTYFVGSHGPFQLSYAKDLATSDRVNQDINAKVLQLRQVLSQHT